MTTIDNDFARMFFGNRQVDVTHFFAINWSEDTERPTRFAVGYWTPDGIYHQGVVSYSSLHDRFAGSSLIDACNIPKSGVGSYGLRRPPASREPV